MAAFWPIRTVQIIRIVSYPIRKRSRLWHFFMWSVKEMYHALLPKAVYRDKGRGHDRRLEKQSQSKPAKLCLFIKQNIKSDWIAFYHKALQHNGKWWLLYLINSDLTNLSLSYEDITNIISLIIYLFSIFFICSSNMTSMYLAVTHTPLKNNIIPILIRVEPPLDDLIN